MRQQQQRRKKQKQYSSLFLSSLLVLFWIIINTNTIIVFVAPSIITTINSKAPFTSDVQYNCIFENQWTPERHPNKYPNTADSH